jgi:hypothetical protein
MLKKKNALPRISEAPPSPKWGRTDGPLNDLRSTELRTCILQDRGKFASVIDGRTILHETTCADEVVLHVETVARVVRRRAALTIDRRAGRVNTRKQVEQRKRVAAIDRQLFNLLFADRVA